MHNTVRLILLAVLAAIIGLGTLSNATIGVGALAFACFLGIMARIAQATAHREEDAKKKAATPT